eukprot:CAMPEP_0180589466 /NCGR_PEP_ID=MMETSP1037_2-20121125/18167_1 /TAXON_ID=632150 /ORGANISM="Azadinium spinosum, Strain 3D9" /LENGTH=59 /DNA_ID=CAMNT_0022607651 /DNA_START=417 /DNA_END=596 /DNA_ORIENTATION=-
MHCSHPAQPPHLLHFHSLSQNEQRYDAQMGHREQRLLVLQSEDVQALHVIGAGLERLEQ